MNTRNRDILKGSLLLIALFSLALWGVCGCIPKTSSPPKQPNHNGNNGNTSFIIDWWMWVGIAGLVAGSVLVVICRNDRFPMAVIAGGGTSLGISLALSVVLPWLKWAGAILLVLGLIWLYANYHSVIWKKLRSR